MAGVTVASGEPPPRWVSLDDAELLGLCAWPVPGGAELPAPGQLAAEQLAAEQLAAEQLAAAWAAGRAAALPPAEAQALGPGPGLLLRLAAVPLAPDPAQPAWQQTDGVLSHLGLLLGGVSPWPLPPGTADLLGRIRSGELRQGLRRWTRLPLQWPPGPGGWQLSLQMAHGGTLQLQARALAWQGVAQAVWRPSYRC